MLELTFRVVILSVTKDLVNAYVSIITRIVNWVQHT